MVDEERVLQSEAVRNFVAAAEAYCAFIENQQPLTLKQFVWEAADRLATLYKNGLALPDIETDVEPDYAALRNRHIEIKEIIIPLANRCLSEMREKLGNYDVYHLVFQPYDDVADEPISFTVAMDLIEIYDDMKEGLVLFSDGGERALQAIWDWKYGLISHWGAHHLVNVLKPITWIMNDIDSLETRLQAQDDDE
jgi:hypothetical protein